MHTATAKARNQVDISVALSGPDSCNSSQQDRPSKAHPKELDQPQRLSLLLTLSCVYADYSQVKYRSWRTLFLTRRASVPVYQRLAIMFRVSSLALPTWATN